MYHAYVHVLKTWIAHVIFYLKRGIVINLNFVECTNVLVVLFFVIFFFQKYFKYPKTIYLFQTHGLQVLLRYHNVHSAQKTFNTFAGVFDLIPSVVAFQP